MRARALLFGTLLFLILGSVLYLKSATGLQRLEDPDGAFLRKAEWRALHPPKHVVHAGALLGVIQVPRVGITVPLVEGSDDESLEYGAGHIPHTAFPGHHGNAGIAAHRDTSFRGLRFIRPGDDIVITTPGGFYEYSVTGTEIVLPTDGRV